MNAFLGGVSHYTYAAIPLIVALSLGHSDITTFCPWSPIVTGNHLDCAKRKKKKPEVAQKTGTVDVIDLHSVILGPTSRRASTRPNLYE
jgi:hypothetical protein